MSGGWGETPKSGTRLVMPEDGVVAACSRHMESVSRQLDAVSRYARREVLGAAGFDGVFRVLVPLLDRIADAVDSGLGVVRGSYDDLGVELVVSARSLASLDQTLASALQPIAAAAAGASR